MFRFHKKYFLFTLALLATEVFIAMYVRDAFVRPYVGDFLVVIFLYCLVKSFLNTPVVKTAAGVLLFSYLVETLQYLKIVNWLGLQNNRIACILIGTSFAWSDIFAYTLGILVVLLLENRRSTAQLR